MTQEKFPVDERWQHGTAYGEELEALLKEPHTALEWKLLNTITNWQHLIDSAAQCERQQARQIKALLCLVRAIEENEAKGAKVRLVKWFSWCEQAGLTCGDNMPDMPRRIGRRVADWNGFILPCGDAEEKAA